MKIWKFITDVACILARYSQDGNGNIRTFEEAIKAANEDHELLSKNINNKFLECCFQDSGFWSKDYEILNERTEEEIDWQRKQDLEIIINNILTILPEWYVELKRQYNIVKNIYNPDGWGIYDIEHYKLSYNKTVDATIGIPLEDLNSGSMQFIVVKPSTIDENLYERILKLTESNDEAMAIYLHLLYGDGDNEVEITNSLLFDLACHHNEIFIKKWTEKDMMKVIEFPKPLYHIPYTVRIDAATVPGISRKVIVSTAEYILSNDPTHFALCSEGYPITDHLPVLNFDGKSSKDEFAEQIKYIFESYILNTDHELKFVQLKDDPKNELVSELISLGFETGEYEITLPSDTIPFIDICKKIVKFITPKVNNSFEMINYLLNSMFIGIQGDSVYHDNLMKGLYQYCDTNNYGMGIQYEVHSLFDSEEEYNVWAEANPNKKHIVDYIPKLEKE